MTTSILASKLGAEFIKTTANNHAVNVQEMLAAIKGIHDLQKDAYDSVISCLSGNGYSVFAKLSQDNKAVYVLNEKTWQKIKKQLNSVGSSCAASSLNDLILKECFIKQTITEQVILDLLKSLESDELLQQHALAVKSEIEVLNGEPLIVGPRFKIKKGTKQERLKLVSKIVELAAFIWNESVKNRLHIPKIASSEIQANCTAATEAVSKAEAFKISNILDLKTFANGNIDFKLSDLVASNFESLAA